MTHYLCRACGLQHAASETPPGFCKICNDDRQYVAWGGQDWTTHEELCQSRSVRIEQDGDLLGVGIRPPGFAIPQRALVVPSNVGNILWDCTSLVTPEAVEALQQRGGISMIAISHPHFYGAMVEWSEAFGGAPILLHQADREWVARSSPHIEFWKGEELHLADDVRLIHCPGHFPGSSVLYWSKGPEDKKILLAGDSLHVTQTRSQVSFVHSVPNHLPMHPEHVLGIQRRLQGLELDDIYGFTWGLNIHGGARAALDASIERHLNAVGYRAVA
jgi:glyoxylase-like metal-dependent hydrolase (beta-lactamase superfamily II)